MELRHLRYFVAVAEELHFGRAAQRLYMAQPPLSQQIRQLEAEIGVTLLARTNRHVQLTEAGQAFLEDARHLLAAAEATVLRARRISMGEQGWLGVGFVGSAMYEVLPAILRRFRERYPAVELVLLELLGNEQEQALEEKRIHVGFARLTAERAGLVQETIVQEPLIVALPAAHRLAAASTIPFRELAEEPFILYPPQSTYTEYVIALCEQAGFSPRIVQKTGEMQTAISLVAASVGVTLVPAAVQNLRREGVAYRSLAEPTPRIALTMTYRQNDTSPVLLHFLAMVRQAMTDREPLSVPSD